MRDYILFEDYVTKANQARTPDELFEIYAHTVRQHGMDRVLLGLLTDHSDIGETEIIRFYHYYPADWMRYYFEKQMHLTDPVIMYGPFAEGCFRWDEIGKAMKLNRAQQSCLDMGREAGLYNGLCTPLRGAGGALAGMGLASSVEKDGFDGKTDLITAYGNHFYTVYRRLAAQARGVGAVVPAANIVLTRRERDILSWLARGKSRNDIGEILCLSAHTVDFHQRNIFRKLGVNSTVLAVARALSYGLIQP